MLFCKRAPPVREINFPPFRSARPGERPTARPPARGAPSGISVGRTKCFEVSFSCVLAACLRRKKREAGESGGSRSPQGRASKTRMRAPGRRIRCGCRQVCDETHSSAWQGYASTSPVRSRMTQGRYTHGLPGDARPYWGSGIPTEIAPDEPDRDRHWDWAPSSSRRGRSPLGRLRAYAAQRVNPSPNSANANFMACCPPPLPSLLRAFSPLP